jgi:SAM-dependent methyltransferase
VVTSALGLYGEALAAAGAADGSPAVVLRFARGGIRPLEISRWVGGADSVDEQALARLDGPVLDVGCGPGRHLHALARRGVFGLGVDLCPSAVELARGRGANAIVGSIFGDVPHAGLWASALLLDGNIGIGGRPARLLERIVSLLAPGGAILVELAAPETSTIEMLARIETAAAVSEWFAWAEVSAASISELAVGAGVRAADVWADRGRWFALVVAP